MARFHFRKAIAFLIVVFAQPTFSEETVNIITWWDYIDPDIVQSVETQCNAKVSIDEYYSDPEFLRRIDGQQYDIAIYSDTVYGKFTKSVQSSQKDLQSEFVPQYLESVQENFQLGHYRSDTVYYQLSITGLLWNPRLILLSKDDTVEAVFEKAKGKTVVMLDEHVEVLYLLSKKNVSGEADLSSISGVSNLFNGVNINVTNALANLTTKDDFAFAFTWSGEAIEHINSVSPDFRFLVHPTLSHVSKDLLTLISDSDIAECVARNLSSKEHLNRLTQTYFYFSPYENDSENTAAYNVMNVSFKDSIDKLESLARITPAQYEILDIEWQKLKMTFGIAP